jgi:hypothetical protein
MAGQNTSNLRAWLACHLVIVALVVALFAPWWWGGNVLAPLDIVAGLLMPWRGQETVPEVHNHFVSDGVSQYLPYRWLAQESFREDGYIGWNNLNAGGINQYANTMALYFDWTMQLHRWLDFWTAWHLGLMGQFILAGCGMLVFLRSRGIGPWLALPAAVAYLGNFQFMVWLYHRWALSAFCWVPWLLWSLMGWRDGQRGRWGLIPVFLALGFLGGTLQHAVYILLIVASVWLARFWKERRQLYAMRRITAVLLLLVLVGFALAGYMFVPCIRAFSQSLGGGQTRGGLGYSHGVMQPVLNLVSYAFYLFPHCWGTPATLDAWKIFKSDMFNVAYFGALPFLVALLALGCRRFPLEARLLVAAGFVIPLTPLVGPLYHRVSLVGITGGVWLFAHALEHEMDWIRNILKRIAPVVWGLIGTWLVISIFIWLAKARILDLVNQQLLAQASVSTFGCLTQWMTQRGNGWVDSWLIWSANNLVPLLAVMAGFFVVRHSRFTRVTGLALAAFLVIETGIYASHWITFSKPSATGLFPETEETRVLRTLAGNGMVSVRQSGLCRMPFPPNTLSVLGIRCLESYESILPRGMVEYLGDNPTPARLALCGVTHLVVAVGEPVNDPSWILVWQNKTIVIYRNAVVWPRYCALPVNVAWDVGLPQKMDAAVVVLSETQNRRQLVVPAGAACIRLAENWSDRWEYSMDGATWQSGQRALDGSLLLPVKLRTESQPLFLRYRRPLML